MHTWYQLRPPKARLLVYIPVYCKTTRGGEDGSWCFAAFLESRSGYIWDNSVSTWKDSAFALAHNSTREEIKERDLKRLTTSHGLSPFTCGMKHELEKVLTEVAGLCTHRQAARSFKRHSTQTENYAVNTHSPSFGNVTKKNDMSTDYKTFRSTCRANKKIIKKKR